MDQFASRDNKRDIAFHDDLPFSMTYEVLELGGGVLISRTAGSLRRSEKRAEHARRNGDGPFVLILNSSALSSYAEAGKRSSEVAPGCAVLFDCAQQNIHTYSRNHHTLALKIPRHRLIGVVRHAPDLHAAVVPARNDALRLFGYYAQGAMETDIADRLVADQVSQNLIDLVSLALGARSEDAEADDTRGLRAARLALVLRHLREDFSDPALSPEKVARRVGISVRYLHDLLHATGSSFSERLQTLRLTMALYQLQGSGRRRRIADIAFDVGFNDLSHFNRVFRRKYGLTPTAARGRQ